MLTKTIALQKLILVTLTTKHNNKQSSFLTSGLQATLQWDFLHLQGTVALLSLFGPIF